MPPKRLVVVEADNETMGADDDRIHQLSLMLISTISSLPMTIMLRALDEVYIIISADDGNNKDEEGSEQSERKGRRKKELLQALFSEIMEKIGDCEKEAALKWWYTHRPSCPHSESGHVDGQEGLLGTILLASSFWFTKRQRGLGKKVKGVDVFRERQENQRSSSNSFVLSRL